MTNLEQSKKAEALRAMHSGGEVLLLPNVWDVASARIVEQAGYGAIATTSAGIAFALGYPDGEKIPRQEMLAAVARIARAVKVPVTADVEAGYGPRPEDAGQTARAVIEAGAVGMNLEDATGEATHPLTALPLQLEKIHAVRETADSLKVPLVLNARTDVYLLQLGEPATRYDAATIARLAADLRCPVNVLAGPGSPSVPELRKLGVARTSLGSGPMRSSLGLLRRLAIEVKSKGTYESMQDAPSHSELNQLME